MKTGCQEATALHVLRGGAEHKGVPPIAIQPTGANGSIVLNPVGNGMLPAFGSGHSTAGLKIAAGRFLLHAKLPSSALGARVQSLLPWRIPQQAGTDALSRLDHN